MSIQRSWMSAIVMAGLVMLSSGGCVWCEIREAQAVPGCGHDYRVIYEGGGDVDTGRVMVKTDYDIATVLLPRIRVKDIHKARLSLSKREDVRVVDVWALFPYGLVDGWLLYKATWVTPHATLILPLVPGHMRVKDGELVTSHWSTSSPPWLHKDEDPDTVIVLRSVCPTTEVAYLSEIIKQYPQYPGISEFYEREDKTAFLEVVKYAKNRLSDLGYRTVEYPDGTIIDVVRDASQSR